jgi:hypothetical protein
VCLPQARLFSLLMIALSSCLQMKSISDLEMRSSIEVEEKFEDEDGGVLVINIV